VLNRVHTKMELEHRDRNEASAKAVGLTATCDAGEDISKIPIINWLWVSTEGAPCCSLLPLLPLNSPLSLSLNSMHQACYLDLACRVCHGSCGQCNIQL
jgi:hypothetical protein